MLLRVFVSVILSFMLIGAAQAERSLTVFAASSMSEAMTRIGEAFEAETGTSVVFSFAGTGTLARQIEAGAPADVFVAADALWMEYLAGRGAVRPDTIVPIASNALVLIGPAGSEAVTLSVGNLVAGLNGGRLAIADPDTVPAGRYGKAALEALQLWDQVADQLAPMENVRVALASVARGDTPRGLVYATDAAIEPGVTVLAPLPGTSHPDIIYPAAMTAVADEVEAVAFLDFLAGPEAAKILRSFSFVVDKAE